ncbi:hypothetical protein DHEL01_v212457 [Diaporthe helianthi]|uniref:Uncharacterized protein n=1 Tax=Diaporthe helianthi TaxID=158607 RepID=A0A2P5HFW8_DIAHE|nr:hypothetical protein DHEL01_v212457 [Diaporthe helianthi]
MRLTSTSSTFFRTPTTSDWDKAKLGDAVSFICPYSGGFKWKADITGNWDWIKTTLCGLNRGGYAQIVGGSGDWTSGTPGSVTATAGD